MNYSFCTVTFRIAISLSVCLAIMGCYHGYHSRAGGLDSRAVIRTITLAQHPTELFDSGGPSSVLDLANLPLSVDLLQRTGLAFTDFTMEGQFKTQIQQLVERVSSGIVSGKTGYLLRVQFYQDEFGTPVVPEGQLVYPVGLGVEPVDALAEDMRNASIQGLRPSSLRDQSYYIWVTNENGLKGRIIPRAFRSKFEEAAWREAQRRELLGHWSGPAGDTPFQQLQRSLYWKEVADNHLEKITSDQRRRRIQALNVQFTKAETTFNEVYKQYQQTLAEIARRQQYAKVLEGAALLADIFEIGVKTNNAMGANQTPVKDDGDPRQDLQTTISINDQEIGVRNQEAGEQWIRLEAGQGELEQIDEDMRGVFNEENIPLPAAPGPIRIRRP